MIMTWSVKIVSCLDPRSVASLRSTPICGRFLSWRSALYFRSLLSDARTAFALSISPLQTSYLEPFAMCGPRVNPVPNCLRSSPQPSITRHPVSQATSNPEHSAIRPSTPSPPSDNCNAKHPFQQ